MDAKQLAEAVYKEILSLHGGQKPKFDSEEVARVMHPLAKKHHVPIFFWPEAVELLQEMLN